MDAYEQSQELARRFNLLLAVNETENRWAVRFYLGKHERRLLILLMDGIEPQDEVVLEGVPVLFTDTETQLALLAVKKNEG
jgi:hypothetical protein